MKFFRNASVMLPFLMICSAQAQARDCVVLLPTPCSRALAAPVACQKVSSGRFRRSIPDAGLNVFQQQDADDFITAHLLQILS